MTSSLMQIANSSVFCLLGALDFILCYLFRVLDFCFNPAFRECYCHNDSPLKIKKPHYVSHPRLEVTRVAPMNGENNEAECVDDSEDYSDSDLLALTDAQELKYDPNYFYYFPAVGLPTTSFLRRNSVSSYVKETILFLKHESKNRWWNCLREVALENVGALSKVFSHEIPRMLWEKLKIEMREMMTKMNCTLENNSTWSDCRCTECLSCRNENELFANRSLSSSPYSFLNSTNAEFESESLCEKNIIFLHGFLSSSSFWTETIYPHLPSHLDGTYRLFAVDILGFGKSPKPCHSEYSLADHIRYLEFVIYKEKLKNINLVAHSMGCIIALALASKYHHLVSSLVLISPPVALHKSDNPGEEFLKQVAPKRIFPLISFGISIMSHYEHLGRLLCAILLHFHKLWASLATFVMQIFNLRLPKSFINDFMRHTHHSSFHNFHNTMCEGVKHIDTFLDMMDEQNVRVTIIHGYDDKLCPVKGSFMLSAKHPNVNFVGVEGGHSTSVVGREDSIAKIISQAVRHSN